MLLPYRSPSRIALQLADAFQAWFPRRVRLFQRFRLSYDRGLSQSHDAHTAAIILSCLHPSIPWNTPLAHAGFEALPLSRAFPSTSIRRVPPKGVDPVSLGPSDTTPIPPKGVSSLIGGGVRLLSFRLSRGLVQSPSRSLEGRRRLDPIHELGFQSTCLKNVRMETKHL